MIGIHSKMKRTLEIWVSRMVYQKLLSVEWERIAKAKGRDNYFRWILRRWRAGTVAKKEERLGEEVVAEKWRQVRCWLQD